MPDNQGGDKFERLYLRYRGLLFTVAIEILGQEQDAEDAVQQGFLSAFQNLEKIGQVDSPKTKAFLVVITERKAIDILRTRAGGQVELEELPGLEVPLPGDGALADAMARLKPGSREILLLRYYMGYSTRETAKILAISRSAAEKQLWRAKQQLKTLLEEGET
ncbi:MAG: sigma-70 family RNA polymerase sigma factor [Oscillospiraceae bacterium]|nr:sigma-70 family RNA polymerase sigma factor [Oscillospiraceae bacterium]